MALSQENSKIIRDKVHEACEHLNGKLPPLPHLGPRNPFAHLYERIRAHMGKSYKDCDDSDVPVVLELIEYYRNNPC